MRTLLLASTIAILLSPSARSQKFRRTATSGTITLASGAKWANAKIVFLARPWTTAPAVDRVEVKSDVNGKYRVHLLPTLEYIAWAVSETDKNGRYRYARFDTCLAGQRLTLEQGVETCLKLDVRLPSFRGKSFEKMQLIVTDLGGNGPQFEAKADKEGKVAFPAFPGRICQLRIRDKEAVQLLTETITLEEDSRKKARQKRLEDGTAWPGIPLGIEVLSKNHTWPLLLRVRSFGKPVAGARLFQASGTHELLAISDAEGWMSFEQPIESSHLHAERFTLQALLLKASGMKSLRINSQFRIRRKGEKREISRLPIYTVGDDLAMLRKLGKAHLSLNITKGPVLSAHVLLQKGRPAPHLYLKVWGRHANGRYFSDVLKTDPKGRFELITAKAGTRYVVQALLDKNVLAALGRRRLHSVAIIARGTVPVGKPKNLDDVVLSLLPMARVAVQLQNLSPANYADVRVVNKELRLIEDMHCDRSGKISFLVPDHGKYQVAAVSKGRLRIAAVDFAAIKTELMLTLAEAEWFQGKVVNQRGQGLAGARISAVLEIGRKRRGLNTLLWQLPGTWVSDKNGEFRIPISPEGRTRLTASWSHEGHGFKSGSLRVNLQRALAMRQLQRLPITLVIRDAPSRKK